MKTGPYIALATGGSALTAIGIGLLVGWLVGAFAFSGCYATTGGPVPTCAQDPHQDGCLAPIHDQRKPDGGAR